VRSTQKLPSRSVPRRPSPRITAAATAIPVAHEVKLATVMRSQRASGLVRATLGHRPSLAGLAMAPVSNRDARPNSDFHTANRHLVGCSGEPEAELSAVPPGDLDAAHSVTEISQHAAEEITGLIGEIQNDTSTAVHVVEDGARLTADGAVVVEKAREAFERIESSGDDMTARIEQIAAASQQIAASATSMQENIIEVAAVAEQSSASTEQVSASTQETTASSEEIAASAQALSSNAEQLNRLVGQFKTVA
jgi:hypothetical protein